jgi:hypothetical protein
MKLRTRTGVLALAATAVLALSGCVGTVPMDPAPDANNPTCASVTVRLPDTVADLSKRETSAQATGAWGEPAAVLLTCGVAAPGPTTMPCITINDVDWIEDDSRKPLYVYTTFGREPAVQVAIDSTAVSGSTALVDVSSAVATLPVTSQCLSAIDGYNG